MATLMELPTAQYQYLVPDLSNYDDPAKLADAAAAAVRENDARKRRYQAELNAKLGAKPTAALLDAHRRATETVNLRAASANNAIFQANSGRRAALAQRFENRATTAKTLDPGSAAGLVFDTRGQGRALPTYRPPGTVPAVARFASAPATGGNYSARTTPPSAPAGIFEALWSALFGGQK